MLLRSLTLAAALATSGDPAGAARMPSVVVVPEAARPSDHFDPLAATNAYLAQIPPQATLRSDAYFEGGYWLMLWDFLAGAAISLLLLELRWSARMRDLAERLVRPAWLRDVLYWIQYSLLTGALGFPLAIYEGYFREHQYGLSTQTLGLWLGDQLKGFAVGLGLGAAALVGFFSLLRRLPRTWWIWGSAATTGAVIVFVLLFPVYLVPIFNTVTPLAEGPIKSQVLNLAHANGVAADEVYVVDASKQSTRISANVSGLAGTLRITLNDNLLRRGSPEEIQAVMGHEIGHYVLHHVYKDLLFEFVCIALGFGVLRWLLAALLARRGQRWGVRDIADPASLPLVLLIGAVLSFVLTPVINSWVRAQEYEADLYGINTSRQPDGEAQADIHLGEYRKMNPGALEELLFFDHPSGRNRIHAAMLWKANNLELFDAQRQP